MEETTSIFPLVLDQLNKLDMWFTTKADPTSEEASSYYKLDNYGEPTEATIKKIEKEVSSLIGDGAVDIYDAIELWVNDQLVANRLDYTDNLVTKFDDKPVVDQIEAYENPVQFPKSVTESKTKKTEGAGAGYDVGATISGAVVNSFEIVNQETNEYGEITYDLNCDIDVKLSDVEFSSYYYGGKIEDFDVNGKITSLKIAETELDEDDEHLDLTAEAIADALDGAQFNEVLGAGWIHQTFTGEILNAELDGSVYRDFIVYNADIGFTDEPVVRFIDSKVSGDLDEDTYEALDEDGTPIESFRDESDAVKFAEENAEIKEIVICHHNYVLLDIDGSEDDDLFEFDDVVWQRDEDLDENKKITEGKDVKVKSSHIEDIGGGNKAVFGQLEDGTYFSEYDGTMLITDYDKSQYVTDDKVDKNSPEHTLWSYDIDNTINNKEDLENYKKFYNILSQTKQYDKNILKQMEDTIKEAEKELNGTNKKTEGKTKKTEGGGAGYEISATISAVGVNSFNITNQKEAEYGQMVYDLDCDIDIKLSNVKFEGYYYGGMIADFDINGKISKLEVSELMVYDEGEEHPTLTNEAIQDALAEASFSIVLGGGWTHQTFSGSMTGVDLNGNTYGEFTADFADIEFTDEPVVDYIDKKVSGELDEVVYDILDEDGEILDSCSDPDEAVKMAKESVEAVEVASHYCNYELLDINGEIEDIDSGVHGEVIWEREYTKVYKYDNKTTESKKVVKEEYKVFTKDENGTKEHYMDFPTYEKAEMARQGLQECGVEAWIEENENFNSCTKDKKETKKENFQKRLNEVNTKSQNLISSLFTDTSFDSDSPQGKIVMRTSEMFNALSDKGYDVEVTFDNGESTSAVQLGQQGGKVLITITNTDQPLRAFTSGNFEITDQNIKVLQDIQNQIEVL